MRTMSHVVVIGCVMTAAGVLMAEDGAMKEAVKEFVQQQKEEKQDFKNELKEKHEEMKDEAAKQHADNVAFLKEQLAKSKLTDGQKEEIVTFIEKQYGEMVVFRDDRLKDLIKKIVTVSNNDSLTLEQKKAILKEYVAKKRAEAKAERKAEYEKAKAEKKAAAKE